MGVIVKKFGGTSLGTASRMKQVADIIKESVEKDQTIVVVSAISGVNKTEGTTSKLLQAKRAALNHGAYAKMIDDICDHHVALLDDAIKDDYIKDATKDIINQNIKKLKALLAAVQVIEEVSPRTQDVIISYGERLSSIVLTAFLNDDGIEAESYDFSQLIQKQYEVADINFFNDMKIKIKERLSNIGSAIPIVTGFSGKFPRSILKDVGRGYSDFTAGLIASSLNADEVQIWKEVDGIFSADPKKVKNAHLLTAVSPEEASELTYYGSEVIHHFTMEEIIRHNIPIRIKNTFKPAGEGTLIVKNKHAKQSNKPIAVTCKKNIIALNINSNRMVMAYGFMKKVFEIFDRHRIIIDLIATSEINVSVTFDKDTPYQPVLKELEVLGAVTVNKELAILSIVGHNMHCSVGISGQFFSILAQNDINILLISQGSSEINISCVIDEKSSMKALAAVHEAMIE